MSGSTVEGKGKDDEIAKTISTLNADTIREALKQTQNKTQGNKPALVKIFEEAVFNHGIRILGDRLNQEDQEQLKATAKLLGVAEPTSGGSSSLHDAVVEKIQSETINKVLEKAEEELLKHFGKVLGLEPEGEQGSKAALIKQIADEVMLIGMEGFLNKLGNPLLKKFCAELRLKGQGEKKDLVNRLMEHIFELEPTEEKKEEAPKKEEKTEEASEKTEEKEKPKENKKRKKADSETTTTTTTAEKKEKPARKATKKEESKEKKKEEEEEKRSTRAKRTRESESTTASSSNKEQPPKKKAKTAAAPRQPYVSPPIETIVKGKYSAADLHNLFNLTVLVEYCKKHSLKHTGTKREIIKRVYNFAETGQKEEKQEKKKKKAASTKDKSKKGGKGKAKKDEAATTTTATTEEKKA